MSAILLNHPDHKLRAPRLWVRSSLSGMQGSMLQALSCGAAPSSICSSVIALLFFGACAFISLPRSRALSSSRASKTSARSALHQNICPVASMQNHAAFFRRAKASDAMAFSHRVHIDELAGQCCCCRFLRQRGEQACVGDVRRTRSRFCAFPYLTPALATVRVFPDKHLALSGTLGQGLPAG